MESNERTGKAAVSKRSKLVVGILAVVLATVGLATAAFGSVLFGGNSEQSQDVSTSSPGTTQQNVGKSTASQNPGPSSSNPTNTQNAASPNASKDAAALKAAQDAAAKKAAQDAAAQQAAQAVASQKAAAAAAAIIDAQRSALKIDLEKKKTQVLMVEAGISSETREIQVCQTLGLMDSGPCQQHTINLNALLNQRPQVAADLTAAQNALNDFVALNG